MKRCLDARSFGGGGCLSVGRMILMAAVTAVLFAAPPALAQSNDLKGLLNRLDRLERDIRTLNIQISRGKAPPVQAAPGGSATASPLGMDSVVARYEVRMTAIEEDVRTTTGQIEEVLFRVTEVGRRLDKLVADVDYRLSALESSLSALSAGTPAEAATPPSVPKTAPGEGGQGFAKPPGVLGTITEKDLQAITPPSQAGEQAPAMPSQAPATPSPAATAQPSAQAKAGVLPQGTPQERYTYAFGLLRQAKYDQAEIALREFVQIGRAHV